MCHIYNHFNAYVLPSGSSSIPDQNFPFLSMKDSASPRSDLVYSRFVVTKLSWKGKYRRILCISPLAISTLDPSAGMALTHTYSLTHGESIAVQGKAGDEGELVLSVKQAVRTAMQTSSCYQMLTALYFEFIYCVRESSSLYGSTAKLNARFY